MTIRAVPRFTWPSYFRASGFRASGFRASGFRASGFRALLADASTGLASHMNAELAGDALAPPVLADPSQAADEHGVVGERLTTIDDPVQQLVVAGSGEPEPLADGAPLGDPQLPPVALEIKDRSGTLVERAEVFHLPPGDARHPCEASDSGRGFKHPLGSSRNAW